MAGKHYAKHIFQSTNQFCQFEHDDGKTCWLPLDRHKPETRRPHNFSGKGERCAECDQLKEGHYKRKTISVATRPQKYQWVGIDGEGQGKSDHKYNFLAASLEDRKRRWSVENMNGIKTRVCLNFILWLPITRTTRLFSFGFNYDLTKILAGLTNEKLYKLFRPETRKRLGKKARLGPRPVRWDYYSLNLQGSKFTVWKRKFKKRIVWDILKFFQCKFVEALKEWKVGEPMVLDNMQYMKDNRSKFDKLPFKDVKEYCFDECAYMAGLARKLFEAHEAAGLHLENFYGAGSSASAMLKKMEIKEKIVPTPDDMKIAVASSYFGGRFENSVIGEILGPVYNYDISSAYPYQTYFLPCLQHARWTKTKNRNDILSADHALVRYRLNDSNTGIRSWGPFPFREADGSICFPITSGGGWVWREEYLQGEKLFYNVEFIEAWTLHTECDCHPFKEIPQWYLERLKIGKEGPGIAIKLGINSCYGKLAQSVGNGTYNCWIWAAMITSGCRAQLLEMLSLHKLRSNVLMMATDGIYSREMIKTPPPRDTGTNIDVTINNSKRTTCKPLGGWEMKTIWKGVFIARPGIYYPLKPTPEELKDKAIKGRGVGTSTILRNHEIIYNSWKDGKETVELNEISRFCGAKTSISRSGKYPNFIYNRASSLPGYELPSYGQWVNRRVVMSFDPTPKRLCVNPDGITLKVKSLPLDVESLPYPKAMKKWGFNVKDPLFSQTKDLIESKQIQMEQPDFEFNPEFMDE